MTPDLWIMIAVLFVCMVLSAFFSACETAFNHANRVRLRMMMQEGDQKARLAHDLMEDHDRLLNTVFIGNNIANIAAVAIAASLFRVLMSNHPHRVTLVTVLVMTALILLLGEVSPKTIARERPERVAMAFARPLGFVQTLVTPINAFLTLLRKLLHRIFKADNDESYIEEELITLVDEAQSEGDIDAHEGELIRSAIEFNDDRDVQSILTPRVDVTAIEDTASMEEAADLFRRSGYSRVPVYHEDMDHIVGILNEKDYYLRKHEGCDSITKIMQPPVYAPTSLKLSKLLKLFQAQKTHIIIVLDEFGGTEGIVTMEDVLEELVGEIYDEHDDVDQEQYILEDGSRLVDGSMQLSELMDLLGVEDIYESDTVGGWAAEVLGIIPFVGAAFETDELSGLVTQMERRRVTQVRVWKNQPREDTADNQE
ncbi:MAG: HlyC/CorC family transporter [Clostridia bacterium]|nr:HlyC/CorC family transporter [Clostridia bacterium]